jgi:hypothetical protein
MGPKYSVGDKIKLNSDSTFERIIIYIYSEFYDENGISSEPYYSTKVVNNKTYPPCPIKQSSIDKYYTKIYENYTIK